MRKSFTVFTLLFCVVLGGGGCTIKVDIDASRAYVLQAKRLEREAKIDQADAAYRLALQADRFNEAALHGLARIHLNRGELQKALPLFQEAVRCSEKTPPFDPAATSASLIILGRPWEAAYILERRLEEEPERGDLRLLLAAAHFKDKRFQKASHEIQFMPSDPQAGVEGPPVLRAAKDLGLDRSALRLLLYEAWSNYLRSVERDKWSLEADEIASRALEQLPHVALFRAHLARLKYLHGEREAALDLISEALEQSPFDIEVVREARCLYIYEGRHADALAAWRRAVPHAIVFAPDNKIKPKLDEIETLVAEVKNREDDSDTQCRLATAYRRMGWIEEAIAQCRRALSLKPGSGKARTELVLLRKHRRYVARIREYFDAVYDNELHGMDVPSAGALAVALREMARSEGIILEGGDDFYSLPFYGREVHVFNAEYSPLAAYFLKFGQYLHLTEIHHPPFCKIMNITAWFENTRGIDTQCVVCDEGVVLSLSGYSANRPVIGGHSSLSREGFYVDFEGLRPGRYYIDMARDAVEKPVKSGASTGFYSDRARDALLARIMQGVDISSKDATFQRLSEAAFNAVAFHELGHVRDLARFVPLWAHIPAHLLEAFRSGFSPSRIRNRLEMRAEAYSFAHSPEPHAVVLNNIFRLRPVASEARYIHYLLYNFSLMSRDRSPYTCGAAKIMEFAKRYLEDEGGPVASSTEVTIRLSELSPEELREIGMALSKDTGLD